MYYWPLGFFYWPQGFFYWPQVNFYWPSGVVLADPGCVDVLVNSATLFDASVGGEPRFDISATWDGGGEVRVAKCL